MPDYKIIDGSAEWAEKFAEFCRLGYETTYPRPDLGITKDLFSKGVFSSPRIVNYFRDRCIRTATQRTWLAVDSNNELLGVVAAQRYPDRCDMNSFYVKTEYKGQGIGHALYQKVLEFAGDLPIQVDVVEYVSETIDMYKHWGFEIDHSMGKIDYDIEEWPEDARRNYRAIYMTKPATH